MDNVTSQTTNSSTVTASTAASVTLQLRPTDPPAFPEFETPAHVPDKTAKSLDKALTILGVHLRFNTRNHRAEWCYVEDWAPGLEGKLVGWRDFGEMSQSYLADEVRKRFVMPGRGDKPVPLKFSYVGWREAVNVILYNNQVDPFQQWLETLPKWDGKHRLSFWLDKIFTIHDDDYLLATWTAKFLILGAVWRTYAPGLKLDEMPVLIGPGGIGKSTALKQLLPPIMPDAFSDSLNLAADNKQRVESLQGRVIVEVSEMVGYQKADMESLKAFLSRTDDGSVRLAFRRNPETMLRRCILAGTADHERPLPNDANLRRFVPVRLVDGNPKRVYDYLDLYRAQLWAEAVAMYNEGKEARLPDGLKKLQKAATEIARSSDVMLEDAVDLFLERGPDMFTLAKIADAVNLIGTDKHGAKVDAISERKLINVLRMRGFQSGRRRGPEGNKRYWYK